MLSLSPSPDALTALPGFFRAPFVLRAARGAHRRELIEVGKRIGLERAFFSRSLSVVLDEFYDILVSYYKCEYVYKNVIADRLFLARHSGADASLVSEFRCGESRADVAIFNGTSTAYEIKTEYDSLAKLPSQIADYRRVFDKIYVVSCKRHESVLRSMLDDDVGLLIYQRDYRIKTIREAGENRLNVSPASIFDCLRRSEYLNVLSTELGYVSDCANSEIFTKAKEKFVGLSAEAAHAGLVKSLRKRDRCGERDKALGKFPRSLKYLGLSLSESKSSLGKAVSALNAPAL